MSSNTDQADINEILLGYFILGGKWTGFQLAADAKKQLNIKKDKVGEKWYAIQSKRAEVMAVDTLKWAKANEYKGKVTKVWWTARPGILSKAVGYDVDSRKNPTDTLLLFSDKQFLGVSAKSTQGKGDIGFKNPGMGTVDKALNIKLKSVVDKQEALFIKKHRLSESKSKRKQEIRKKPSLVKSANIARDATLKKVRDAFLKKLLTLKPKVLRDYLMTDWMDVGDVIRPPYIKVTGHSNKPPFTSTISDPLKNSKSTALQTKKIKLEKVGNDAVGVTAGGKRIMKMRAKYESQAMASSMKFTGDPW